MSEAFAVRAADLLTHGGHVEAVAAGVTQAEAAGRAVRAGADAYGKLCTIVPAMLSVLQDVLVEGIADSAASLRDTGARVRVTAEQYDSTDRVRAQAIERAGSGR